MAQPVTRAAAIDPSGPDAPRSGKTEGFSATFRSGAVEVSYTVMTAGAKSPYHSAS